MLIRYKHIRTIIKIDTGHAPKFGPEGENAIGTIDSEADEHLVVYANENTQMLSAESQHDKKVCEESNRSNPKLPEQNHNRKSDYLERVKLLKDVYIWDWQLKWDLCNALNPREIPVWHVMQ